LSAMFAYFLGMFVGGDLLKSAKMAFFSRWRERLNENSFMGVLFMRLVYLPFDLVNYGCGALGIRWKAYTLATFIGILPGLVTFVSIGASLQVDQLVSGFDDIVFVNIFDGRQVVVSLVLFGVSLLLAKMVHLNGNR
ncbi:MAG: TVP38/TMEM64 family protein, partial [Nitrospinota bacterium]